MQPPTGFPASFVWGAATSAFQIEGSTRADGRGRSIWDTYADVPGRIANGDTGEPGADHYRRVEQDVELMVALGLDGYRFSVAWPRIVPDGDGDVEPRGLAFYRHLVSSLREAGIEPVVTLYHWDLPQALQDRGGWVNRATADAFVRYARIVHDALGDEVDTWTTLNEPWCSAFLGYARGRHAPGLTDPRAAFRAAHHLLLAHGDGVAAMRRDAGADHDLGIVLNLYDVVPGSGAAADVAAAHLVDGLQNRLWLDAILAGGYPADVRDLFERFGADDAIRGGDERRIAQPLDLLGVNYYQQHRVVAGRSPCLGSAYPGAESAEFVPDEPPYTAMGWGVAPGSLEALLLRLHEEYDGPPIVICENGAAFDDVVDADGRIDDPERRDFIDAHVRAVGRAIAADVDVRGYFVWTLLDNFEWARGYAKRFGIVYVDHDTQVRTVKTSGAWYRELIRSNRTAATSRAPGQAGTP
jgi:beta-glucosidase